MKFSKKTRDEAILILDVAASHAFDVVQDGHLSISLHMVHEALGISGDSPAAKLARVAYGQVYGVDAQARGDAAGLLRDGWCPGDPVEVR